MAYIYIYIYIIFTSSSRSTEFKDILPWNISQMINDIEDPPNQHENSHKSCNETRHPVVNLIESQWETSGGKAIVEQILASEERNKSKRTGL